jgi:hypothetical protein
MNGGTSSQPVKKAAIASIDKPAIWLKGCFILNMEKQI